MHFQFSKAKLHRRLWNTKVNVNAKNFIAWDDINSKAVFKRIREEQFVYIELAGYLKLVIESNHLCDIAVSKDVLSKRPIAWVAQKGFPYADMFNKRWILMLNPPSHFLLFMQRHSEAFSCPSTTVHMISLTKSHREYFRVTWSIWAAGKGPCFCSYPLEYEGVVTSNFPK